MSVKYMLSVCYLDNNQEIFSEPFEPFDSYEEAKDFAENKIAELSDELAEELSWTLDDVEENFTFDYTIKQCVVSG